LKAGTWHSFFERLKGFVAGSLITVERFRLGGECLVSWAVYGPEERRWGLDSLASPDQSLRDSLVEFIFRDGAFPPLYEGSYKN
jgi:hypothetical protein